MSLGSFSLDFSKSSFWTMLIFGLVINLQNFAADQTYVQRYFTAKSEGDARRSVWMGAIAYLPISAVLFFIGTGLFVFYGHSGTLPADTAADAVLPHFIMHELPTGLSGLLIAAILAAAMSTVDSSLNSSATLLLCDINHRFIRTHVKNIDGSVQPQDGRDLSFLRVMTVVLGVAGIGMAMAMRDVKQLLDAWWQISGVLSGGTLGLILLARFTKAAGARGPALGVISGVLATGVITIAGLKAPPAWLQSATTALRPVRDHLHPLMAVVVGTLMVLFFGVVLSEKQKAA